MSPLLAPSQPFVVDSSGNVFAFFSTGSEYELVQGSGSWTPGSDLSVNNPLWSGYVVTAAFTKASAVGGTWVEPTVSGPGATSIWVGIDGYGGKTVEQIGVSTSVNSSGVTVYTPWIEFYGDTTGYKADGVTPTSPGKFFYETDINTVVTRSTPFTVHAGDTISAEVSLVPGTTSTFVFQMTDVPSGGGAVETFTSPPLTMQHVVPQLSTAEWIVENPNSGAQPLASFTPVTFTGAWATIGSQTGSINSFPNPTVLNLSSPEGNDVVTNSPSTVNVLGFNEPSVGASSSTFVVVDAPLVTNTLTHGLSSAVNTANGVTGASSGFVSRGPGVRPSFKSLLCGEDLKVGLTPTAVRKPAIARDNV